MGARVKLGYTDLSGADFGIENKRQVADWQKGSITLYEIETDVGGFRSHHPGQYHFIHISHVIEHIPKYSLLWTPDALYQALNPGGMRL